MMNRLEVVLVHLVVMTWVMPAPVSAQPVPQGDSLAESYLDKSFGYAIRPPADYILVPHKQLLANGQIQLVRFISPDTRSILTVRHAKADRPIEKNKLLEAVVAEARAGHPDAEVIKKSARLIANLPGAVCTIRFVSDGREQIRQQAVVLAKANEVFIIVFDAVAHDPESFSLLFREVLDSFEIIYSELSQKKIEQALQRGTGLLAEIKERAGSIDLVPIAYWRFENGGEHVGFVRVKERQIAKNGLPGIEIEEKAWFFTGENALKQLHNTIFLSHDMTRESWENITETQIERPGGVAHTHEFLKGLRLGNKLALAYTEVPGDLALTNDVLEVSPSYIPAVLIRIFSRLVDLKKPQIYAFASYQTDTRALVLRTFRVVGPARPPGLDYRGPVYKIEDSEGMVPPVSEVYVDRTGRILRIVAGNMVMMATQWKEVEMLYKDKMVWADRLVQRANQQTIQQFQSTPAQKNAIPPGRLK